MTSTFPHLLLQQAKERPGAPALREKEYGIWQTWSWAEVARDVRHMACGLAALGFRRGENLSFVSGNRPYCYMGFIAVQSLGGVPIPLYQDAVAGEMAFVLEDAEVRFAYAEDQEQVDKLLEIRESLPGLEFILYEDPRGLRHYDQPGLVGVQALLEKGRAWDAAHPGAWEAGLAQLDAQDTSIILYTSGTTGRPKGVCLSHAGFVLAARGGQEVDALTPAEDVVSYLPPAWAGDYLFSVAQWIAVGFTINCPEDESTVAIDLREIGPTYYFAPPRIFEGLLTSVSIRMEDAARIKRWLFQRCMQLAKRVGADILDGKPVGAWDRLKYRAADLLIYGPLKNVMGLSRIRVAYTAGRP